MMKVEVTNVTATIALHVASEGSVLAQTVQARANKIEIHYEIESSNTPAEVAGLLRNARNGCYVRQTIADPKLFHDTVHLIRPIPALKGADDTDRPLRHDTVNNDLIANPRQRPL